MTTPTIAVWSRLLQSVPKSRLLLHARAGSHRERVRTFLREQGISPEGRNFLISSPPRNTWSPTGRSMWHSTRSHYGGGTTTCDALWMGVPVVSLTGQTAVGGGSSILSNIGLPELVARDAEQYVRIAVEFG